jgi:hypothetical protein
MKKKSVRRIRNTILVSFTLLLLLFAGGYVIAQVYKDEILAEVQKTINEKISGTLEIEDINFTIFNHFPSFSLSLQNAVLRDSMFKAHQTELFRAEKLLLQIEWIKLLQGEIKLRSITISNAKISLVKMKNGYANTSIIRKRDINSKEPATSSSSLNASVNKVILKNAVFSMVDSVKNKWFSIQFKNVSSDIVNFPEMLNAKIEGNLHFGGLAFNAEKGSYLTNKNCDVNLTIQFDTKTNTLHINRSSLYIDGSKFLLRGEFQFNEKPHMHLEIDAPEITVALANTILTQHIASKLATFNFQNPLIAGIRIDGYLYPGSKPAVDVFFKTTGNTLLMKSQTFTEVNTLGWFQNHFDSLKINDDHNSKVILPRFDANMGGIPIISKLTITDLIDPHLNMKATVDMAMEDANGIADTTKLILNAGTLSVSFNYLGKLLNNVDTISRTFLASVTGNINIRNGDVVYVPRGFHFSKINADMVFGDSLLSIHELNLEINENALDVTGTILGFIPFLFVRDQSLSAELVVHAGILNLDNFIGGKSSKQVKTTKTKKTKKAAQKQVNQTIDQIINTMEADILLSADKVTTGRFTASKISGHVILADEFIKFKNINMITSGGTFALNGSVTNLQSAPYRMSISTSISNADISSLFYSFNNFNQDVVTNENVKGKISSKAEFHALLRKDNSIDPKSMNGNVTFSIKKGSLDNMKGLEKISEFAFKNRDFSHIEFAQIKDTITIKGPSITLTRMQILSSVVTIYVEGTYGFQGGTDMSVQVPLSNLKKREKEIKDVKISDDTKLGPSVFLRIRDNNDGKIQIAYDPFKDYYKEKTNASTNTKKEVSSNDTNNHTVASDSISSKKGKKKQK